MAESSEQREPWLRGPIPGVHPVIGAVLHSFQHAVEDLEKWTADITDEQIWERHGAIAPLGAQIRHIGGSVDRLMTYALGKQLSVAQFADLHAEREPAGGRAELLEQLREILDRAGTAARQLDSQPLDAPRAIGRSRLATTLGGLLVHIAEHTQRHVGEAIVTVKVLKAGAS